MLDFDRPETKAFMADYGDRGTPSLWVLNPTTNEFSTLSVTPTRADFWPNYSVTGIRKLPVMPRSVRDLQIK